MFKTWDPGDHTGRDDNGQCCCCDDIYTLITDSITPPDGFYYIGRSATVLEPEDESRYVHAGCFPKDGEPGCAELGHPIDVVPFAWNRVNCDPECCCDKVRRYKKSAKNYLPQHEAIVVWESYDADDHIWSACWPIDSPQADGADDWLTYDEMSTFLGDEEPELDRSGPVCCSCCDMPTLIKTPRGVSIEDVEYHLKNVGGKIDIKRPVELIASGQTGADDEDGFLIFSICRHRDWQLPSGTTGWEIYSNVSGDDTSDIIGALNLSSTPTYDSGVIGANAQCKCDSVVCTQKWWIVGIRTLLGFYDDLATMRSDHDSPAAEVGVTGHIGHYLQYDDVPGRAEGRYSGTRVDFWAMCADLHPWIAPAEYQDASTNPGDEKALEILLPWNVTTLGSGSFDDTDPFQQQLVDVGALTPGVVDINGTPHVREVYLTDGADDVGPDGCDCTRTEEYDDCDCLYMLAAWDESIPGWIATDGCKYDSGGNDVSLTDDDPRNDNCKSPDLDALTDSTGPGDVVRLIQCE